MRRYEYSLRFQFDAKDRDAAREIAYDQVQLAAAALRDRGAERIVLDHETLVELSTSLHIHPQDGLDRGSSAAPSETASQPVVSP